MNAIHAFLDLDAPQSRLVSDATSKAPLAGLKFSCGDKKAVFRLYALECSEVIDFPAIDLTLEIKQVGNRATDPLIRVTDWDRREDELGMEYLLVSLDFSAPKIIALCHPAGCQQGKKEPSVLNLEGAFLVQAGAEVCQTAVFSIAVNPALVRLDRAAPEPPVLTPLTEPQLADCYEGTFSTAGTTPIGVPHPNTPRIAVILSANDAGGTAYIREVELPEFARDGRKVDVSLHLEASSDQTVRFVPPGGGATLLEVVGNGAVQDFAIAFIVCGGEYKLLSDTFKSTNRPIRREVVAVTLGVGETYVDIAFPDGADETNAEAPHVRRLDAFVPVSPLTDYEKRSVADWLEQPNTEIAPNGGIRVWVDGSDSQAGQHEIRQTFLI